MSALAHEPARGARAQCAGVETNDEAAEAARQRALLRAVIAPCTANTDGHEPDLDTAGDTASGLRAYRANAHASAERALALACPTLRALVGPDDFTQLAREFWHAHPPQRGDLGDWGDTLPDWLAAHAGLAEWPYLADCARLDLALHRCERAAEASLDAASLALLRDQPPDELRLRLRPGVDCITSRWPISTLHAAHAAGADEGLLERAREHIQAGEGEAAVVARDGFRGVVHRIDAAGAAFMQAIARDASLSRALAVAGTDFDFTAWLADALRCQWLQRVERIERWGG